jgi:acyl-CoA hydrolase
MDPRPAAASRSILVKWMGIEDANSAGFVHGGTVMYLCDEAVHVGQLLTLESSVNAAWRTSVEVGVRVTAEDVRTGEKRHTNTAYLTMVAIDEDGRPTEVPPLACESDEELRREGEAQMRRANRLAERDQIVRAREAKGEPT